MDALDSMEVDSNAFLYYCVAAPSEGVDPSPDEVRRRGRRTGVAAGTTLADALTVLKAQARAEVRDEVDRLSLKPCPAWVPVTPQASAYVCKAGDQLFFKIARCGSAVAGGVGSGVPGQSSGKGLSDEEVLSYLLKHYGPAARASRTRRTKPMEHDLGQEFEIRGRDSTYQVLLKGSAGMFRTFLRPGPSPLGHRRSQPFIFGMVAFPGAGKTTLGTRTWDLINQHWHRLSDADRRELLQNRHELLLHSEEDYQRFVKMCDNSLRYNLCSYHMVAHLEGGLLELEAGLNATRILALRCFAAIVGSDEGYPTFLQQFEKQCPGFKSCLTLKLVLKFLRAVLPNLEEDTELLVWFFFDEVNAITKDLDGKVVMSDGHPTGGATWMQSVLSAYIVQHFDLASEFHQLKVFPVLAIATTRFSAGELNFTESAQTRALVVPFPPLSTAQSVDIVLRLLQSWATILGEDQPRELTESVMTLVRLSGGMPRALARGLEAIYGSYEPTEVVRRSILEHCTNDLRMVGLHNVINRWTQMMDQVFHTYLMHDDAKPVLLRILLRSLTATTVQRDMRVVETGNFSNLRYTDLEAAGLVALTPPPNSLRQSAEISGGAQLMEVDDELEERQVVSLDPYMMSNVGVGEVLVRCCPLVVYSLLKSGHLRVDIPYLLSTDHRKKEVDDLAGILLRIYLLEVSENRQTFTLGEILPPGTIIPDKLARETFRLHRRCYAVQDWNRKGPWTEMLQSYPQKTAFVGPGNEGADGLVLLQKVTATGSTRTTTGLFFLVVQSKQITSQRAEGFTPLLENYCNNLRHLGIAMSDNFCYKDVARELNKKNSATDALERVSYNLPEQVADFAYCYCSNMKYSGAHIKLGPKLIVAYERLGQEYEDASNILALLRTLRFGSSLGAG